MHDDDVDFVEQSVLQALDINDPVYIVGLQYYTTRKKSPISPENYSRSHRG
jgi:hypothetical protein